MGSEFGLEIDRAAAGWYWLPIGDQRYPVYVLYTFKTPGSPLINCRYQQLDYSTMEWAQGLIGFERLEKSKGE